MDGCLHANTWHLGWADTGFAHGTQQKCCGANCKNEVAKSMPLIYR
jgi:hypothetical protein